MRLAKAQKILLSSSLSVFLVGCGAPNYSQSEMHMTVEEVESQAPVEPSKIPSLVKSSPTSPVISGEKGSDTFDVVVTKVPVRDLLFALARDAGVNMDVDDKVGGFVTLSALDQTLDAILERISGQVDIRIERVGDAILIKPDEPYFEQYSINFLNVTRSYSSSSEITALGNASGDASVSNTSDSDFWTRLEEGIQTILDIGFARGSANALVDEDEAGDAQVVDSEGGAENLEPAYNLNRDTGVLIVFAQKRLQDEVRTLLDRTHEIASRQVLLEATIVEVVLNNQYTQGIDWSVFNSLSEEGLGLYQGSALGGAAAALEYITENFTWENEFTATVVPVDINGDPVTNPTASDYQRGEDNARRAVLEARDRFFSRYEDDPYTTLISRESDITREDALTETVGEGDSATEIQVRAPFYVAEVEVEVQQLNRGATDRSSGGIVPISPNPDSFFTGAFRKGDISAAVQLLDSFGDAKVLSSPRISALNHQPAILRVVDQEVYFTFEVDENISTETGQSTGREITVEENTVDVGFAMNVLPFISPDGDIILNLKPSVTRILEYRRAPTPPGLGGNLADNVVPITRVRELESVISLRDGEVAVLGGLLEDRTGDTNSSVPGLSKLPGVGALFENRNESTFKTEFVVFIRASIIKNPSLNGDYARYKHLLPDSDFILRDTDRTLLPAEQEDSR